MEGARPPVLNEGTIIRIESPNALKSLGLAKKIEDAIRAQGYGIAVESFAIDDGSGSCVLTGPAALEFQALRSVLGKEQIVQVTRQLSSYAAIVIEA